MFGLGMPELLVIFLLALLLFGAKGIPDIARNFGKSMNAFKKGLRESQDELDQVKKEITEDENETK